jgi:CRP-like cAMP-binding protein
MLIERHKISEQFFNNAFRAADLFSGLSHASQNSLRAVKLEKEFARDETIFASGQMPRGIYILTEGEAQTLYHGVEPVHLIEKNEILGVPETISNLPFETSVKTLVPCRFEFIRRDAFLAFLKDEPFLAFLKDEPETCFRLLQILGANLHKLYRFFH